MKRPSDYRLIAMRALSSAVLCVAGCADPKGIEPVPELDVLQVLPASGSLEVGQTASLGALRVRGSSSTNVTGSAAWTSDDENVLTVSYDVETGAVVEAVGLGTARIRATDGRKSATAEFIVRPSIVAIELDKRGAELAKGTALPLGATLFDSRGAKVAYDESGTWGSSAPAIASVDQSGVVTGVEVGEATITLTRGGISASQRVFVRDWSLVSIEAIAVAGTILPFGRSSAVRVTGVFTGDRTQVVSSLFALALDAPADPSDDAEAALTLSDATVTAGATEGSSTLTGTGLEGSIAEGQSFTIEFAAVDAPLRALALELPPVLAIGGDSATASIVGTYGEGLSFETGATLSAEPANLVSIDNAAGTVAPVAPGTVEITASVMLDDGDDDPMTGETITATDTVEVVGAAVSLLTIALASDDDSASIPVGGTTALTLAAAFGGAASVDVTELAVWTSSDESIAVVSNVAAGNVTGFAPGEVTISATYRGATAQFTVTVSP